VKFINSKHIVFLSNFYSLNNIQKKSTAVKLYCTSYTCLLFMHIAYYVTNVPRHTMWVDRMGFAKLRASEISARQSVHRRRLLHRAGPVILAEQYQIGWPVARGLLAVAARQRGFYGSIRSAAESGAIRR
jgi:hypothetical protein